MTTTLTETPATAVPGQARSVAHMFIDRVRTTPNAPAFMRPTDPGWRTYSWQQTYDEVEPLAAGLVALGLGHEQRAAIASTTRFEWVIADLAILLAGGAVTTVYPQTEAEDVEFILNDSATLIVFAEDDEQVAKLLARRAGLPGVTKVVMLTEGTLADGDWVITTAELAALGREHLGSDAAAVSRRVEGIESDHLATLMYTSGTTGRPKGVELLHRNWTYEGAAVAAEQIIDVSDIHFLWLPLAHSFGSVLLANQLQVGFVTAIDGRVPKIVENLGEVRPTLMAAVPRIFERVHARVAGDVEAAGGLKAKIFAFAVGVGRQVAEDRLLRGVEPSGMTALKYRLADRLVFSKLRARMGGRIRYFVSGAAPLSQDVAWFFEGAGLRILEGYGLTETSAATTLNRPTAARIGTVGQPFPGTQIRIAGDGEILIKGPGVMRGYHNLPERTAEVLIDGWLHTGDVGELDDLGRVRITDRKSDLVKMSTGKFVALSYIESRFKGITRVSSNMIVQAAGRPYVTALIAIDPEALAGFAAQHGLSGDYAALVADPALIAQVTSEVATLNRGLNPWEQVKKFEILPADLTVENGGITPSLKVRRSNVNAMHADLVAAMYGGA